ncbi:MAG: methionine--tRNA ligase [Saprospiraceae bacterium]|nr:methionine--tRNA ligase [Saprospiraceae bacterium]MBK8547680.1 methionine--tRNA ligase [Saprospiraceae bacterium]
MRHFKRYLVTSALPYANGPLHIGHLAGAYLSADVYVRFQRLMGKDILFICGSDEHGAAITIKAMKEGLSPQEIVDKYHTLFKDTFQKMGISFDIYHRTSSPLHHETSQSFFKKLYDKKEFSEQESEQYFDEKAGQFLADRYIKGNCPKCNFDGAYGDQCENCGTSLSPNELIHPKSMLSGETPVLKKTKHWYLPLDKYEGWLREWIETGYLNHKEYHDPNDWKNHVLGQCKSWLDSGLQPRAMTRDLDWGVDVPHQIPGHEGKKLYVWMDAPIGYISATKQWALDHKKDWKKYWQSEDSALIHFIGKDNIVFHCLIFPAILKAHGDYILPFNVPANQFMNLEGDKISTSRNWAVWVHEYLEDIPNKQDELRYTMIKNMPEQKDSEFTWKGYQDAVNNELVNNLANFVNRVVVLTHKFYGGKVPKFDEGAEFTGPEDQYEDSYHDSEMLRLYDDIYEVTQSIREYKFKDALKGLMEISSKGNQILQFNEPWKTIKDEPERVKAVMNLVLQYTAAIRVLIYPFLPFTSDKITAILQLPPLKQNGDLVKMMNALSEGKPVIKAGHVIGDPNHLFTKIDDEVISEQIQKLQQKEKMKDGNKVDEHKHEPVKETIQFEDFQKIDLRIATIVAAEAVPKADKLLKLSLNLGFETRTVVSGIAQHYKPEELIGKQVVLVANLAPRTMKGIESKGMVLLAENGDGKLSFVSPESIWPEGYGVK